MFIANHAHSQPISFLFNATECFLHKPTVAVWLQSLLLRGFFEVVSWVSSTHWRPDRCQDEVKEHVRILLSSWALANKQETVDGASKWVCACV